MNVVDIMSEIVIDRDRRLVSEFASDPDNVKKWYVNIKNVAWLTPKPMQKGTRIAFNSMFLGRKFSYTYEVTELLETERLVMRTAAGPFPMETIYTWEDAGEGKTSMRLRNRCVPSGFARILAPLMSGSIRRANQKDLELLKKTLEENL